MSGQLCTFNEALEALGVDAGQLGDPGALKSAYRTASRKHHPDFGGNVDAMQRVNYAYDLLSKQAVHIGRDADDGANRRHSLTIVRESMAAAFDPRVFAGHFQTVTGKPFTSTVEDGVHPDTGIPRSVHTAAEWRSDDNKTVFSLRLSISLTDVTRVRMLGGDSDENLAFTVMVIVEILHDKRKSKFKQSRWSSSTKARTLMDPEDLFPASKIKAMLTGKEKTRKFSRRDMELGIEKLLDGRLDRNDRSLWALIPVGAPQESSDPISQIDQNRFVITIFRTVMTFHRVSYASWSWRDLHGPHIPKVGRQDFSTPFVTATESEELLQALADARTATAHLSDGAQIASRIHDAFKTAQAAYNEANATK